MKRASLASAEKRGERARPKSTRSRRGERACVRRNVLSLFPCLLPSTCLCLARRLLLLLPSEVRTALTDERTGSKRVLNCTVHRAPLAALHISSSCSRERKGRANRSPRINFVLLCITTCRVEEKAKRPPGRETYEKAGPSRTWK